MYVILGYNSDRKVAVLGTRTGKPFGSQRAAERSRRILEATRPTAGWLVTPIQELEL